GWAEGGGVGGERGGAREGGGGGGDRAAELARADPTNRAQAADLGERETIVCKAQRAHHELGAAIASCRAAVDAFAELIAFEPRNASWQTALMSASHQLMLTLRAVGDLAGALAAARRTLALAPPLTDVG